MMFNYQIVAKPNEKGKYVPDYSLLKNNASCQEERDYIQQVAERGHAFAFNMVYVMKMSCGHFEIFQHHVFSEAEALEWLNMMAREDRKCTRCICNWDKRGG